MLLTYGTAAPNPVKNLSGAGLGCQNWPHAGPAGTGAEIRLRQSHLCCAILGVPTQNFRAKKLEFGFKILQLSSKSPQSSEILPT